MPAWIAGIHQVCKDASGDIHVNLDSSTPCWNDAVEGFCFELIEVLCPVFSKGDTEFAEIGVLLDQNAKLCALGASAVRSSEICASRANFDVTPYRRPAPGNFWALRTFILHIHVRSVL